MYNTSGTLAKPIDALSPAEVDNLVLALLQAGKIDGVILRGTMVERDEDDEDNDDLDARDMFLVTWDQINLIDEALTDGQLCAEAMLRKHGYPPQKDINRLIEAQKTIQDILEP